MAVKKRQLSFIPDEFSFPEEKEAFSKNPIRKGLWIFVILASTCLLSYHLATLIIEYEEFQVTTVVINRMYHFEFPNITICRKQPFSVRKRPPWGIGVRSAMRFWMYALNMTNNAENREIAFEQAMSSFEEYAEEKDIYDPILDDFHMCQYMDEPCELADFHKVDFHGHFNCIVFAPRKRRFVSLGKHYGLRIIVSSGGSYGIASETQQFNLQEGYNIMVHDNAGDIMEVMPWNLVTIRLKMMKYKNENTPPKPCYEEEDWTKGLRQLIRKSFPPEEYGHCNLGTSMTEGQCISVKYMIRGLKKCKCLPNKMTMPMSCSVKSMTSCHKLPKEFFYNTRIDKDGTLHYKDTTISLRKDPRLKQIVDRVKCHHENVTLGMKEVYSMLDGGDCPFRCLRISYEASLTSNKWPDSRQEMLDTLSTYESTFDFLQRQPDFGNFSRRNFSSILVYPETLNVEDTTQDLSYPLVQLISDFGGTIGLWLGFSFLTLVEFFEITISLVVYFTTRNKKKAEADKEVPEIDSLLDK